MVAHINAVAFHGLKTELVDVQVHIGDGLPSFQVVGLADKSVNEAKERVRSALSAMGIALPPKRITINLSPADMIKEGSHYDLPIALGLLTTLGVLPAEEMSRYTAMGELALDGVLVPVAGILPGAVFASSIDTLFICPEKSASEALWAGSKDSVVGARDLLQLINAITGKITIPPPAPFVAETGEENFLPDMQDVRGQESAKRAFEIAAAGGHNILMMGPPGSGKSMIASRMPSILPPLQPREALDVSLIYSISGLLGDGNIVRRRPYRAPHFGASTPALVGGGRQAKPGEISLAHNGVLFLDELPEFPRTSIESLRQPIETGDVVISRVNAHVTYPANFQLIAAMNPCRCADVDNIHSFCKRGEKCSVEYQARISGPMYDRFDMFIEVPAVSLKDLSKEKSVDTSAVIRKRVICARNFALQRFKAMGIDGVFQNAKIPTEHINDIVKLCPKSAVYIEKMGEKLQLTARSYYRVLRLARTIADLENSVTVEHHHLTEALSYRRKKI